MIIRILILFLFANTTAFSQTFDWWQQTVNWDGVSHWSRYMITQPAYQGPNSLPVPRIGNGSIDSVFSIGATVNAHFSNGDNTQNLMLYGNYCIAKGKVAIDIQWVPYEKYSMSHAIKTKRHVFSHNYYDKTAIGEAHVNTTIQLLNKWRDRWQLALRLGYRFPCGSGYATARYTDGPGYYFDLSFGKPLSPQFKWIGMVGFYTWQLVSDDHRQDDAFLFGSGLEWNRPGWRAQGYVAGYLGYLKSSGDKPVVARLSLEKKLSKSSLLFGFQQGLHDFAYSSFEAGFKFILEK
jgi:hypothetical protein